MPNPTVEEVFEGMSEAKRQAVYYIVGSLKETVEKRRIQSQLGQMSDEELAVTKFIIKNALETELI